MEEHGCRPLQDPFSSRYLCIMCGKEFVEKDADFIKCLNSLMAVIYFEGPENEPLATNEGVLVWIKERLEELS